MASREPVSHRDMGKKAVNRVSTCRAPWLICNNRPNINASDAEGWHGRILEFHCVGTRREGTRNDSAWHETITKREGPHILHWLFSLDLDSAETIVKAHLDSDAHKEMVDEIKQDQHKLIYKWLGIVHKNLKESDLNWRFGFELDDLLPWVPKKLQVDEKGYWVDGPAAYERIQEWLIQRKALGYTIHDMRKERFYQGIEALGGTTGVGRCGKLKTPANWNPPKGKTRKASYRPIRLPLEQFEENPVELSESELWSMTQGQNKFEANN